MKSIHRVFEYIDYKGIKPMAFEKEVGLSNGYLGKQLKRNADLGESILVKIIEKCPELCVNWLMTGTGEMIKSSNQNNINKGTSINSPMNNISGSSNFSISHNDFEDIVEIMKTSQNHLSVTQNQLSVSQNQLTNSQEQITKLLDIMAK